MIPTGELLVSLLLLNLETDEKTYIMLMYKIRIVCWQSFIKDLHAGLHTHTKAN